MLSVIIPTVQKKLEVLRKLVRELNDDSSVDEILVINNKPETSLDLGYIQKLQIYTPESNLYVNKSWNLGIEKIKNESFLILNDDLLLCKDFCKFVVQSEIFNNDATGLIGVCPSAIKQYEKETDMIDVPPRYGDAVFREQSNYMGTGDWGVAIFGKKKNYYSIPDNLKILYGDNYLLYKNKQNNKKNYSVANLRINHIHSSSSASREFSSIIVSDIKNSKQYFTHPNTSVMTKNSYIIEFRGDVCFIRMIYEDKNVSICLKFKDSDKIYSKQSLTKQILTLLRTQENFLITQIVNDIINQNKAY